MPPGSLPQLPLEAGAGAVNPGRSCCRTIGCNGGREPSGGNPASDTHEVPFYDRDAEHWMTVELEFDDAGEPPELMQLAGPEAGRGMQCQFRRKHRLGSDPPWAYMEISRMWRASLHRQPRSLAATARVRRMAALTGRKASRP